MSSVLVCSRLVLSWQLTSRLPWLLKAHDAHRKVNASLPTSPAEAVTVGLALEEELAPLDRLVPMPLVRTLRLERQVRLCP